jgi:carbon starvation protein CstA
MFFAVVTLLEALFKRKHVYLYTWLTVIFFFVSGLILGPMIQDYAFGAFWTGWPFGHDLTDNKTLASLIIWIIALFVLRKNRENRIWPVIAFVVMLIVFLIPHSVLGSEVDFTKEAKMESTK